MLKETRRKRVVGIAFILMLILAPILWKQYQNQEKKEEISLDTVMSAREIAQFREEYPQFDAVMPVMESQMRSLAYYLHYCDFVLVEYVEEVIRDKDSHYTFRFEVEEVVWQNKSKSWSSVEIRNEDGTMNAFVPDCYWMKPKYLIPGARYVVPVGAYKYSVFEEEIQLELLPHHMFYVTEENAMVAATYEEEAMRYDGCSLDEFVLELEHIWQKGCEIEPELASSRLERLKEYSKTLPTIKDLPELSEEEITVQRIYYPEQNYNYGFDLIETAIPGDWGANFAHTYLFSDAIVVGTLASEVLDASEKQASITWGDWEGTISDLEIQNMPLIDSNRFATQCAKYYTFYVEEIIWKKENQNISLKVDQELLLNHHPNSGLDTDLMLQKGQKYVLGLSRNQFTGTYGIIRNSSFHMNPEGYLFSFVSGENLNQFTGKGLRVYLEAMEDAMRKYEKNPPTQEEAYDFFKYISTNNGYGVSSSTMLFLENL